MITPQLTRCRMCKTFLHGTRIEGFLLESLLPERVQRSPGTISLSVAIVLYYVLMLATAQDPEILGFSSFTLQQLGATHGPGILLGQWWRFVTSIFGHHDLLHLALNIVSLLAVGEIVERIFDRKKMILIYLASGVISMVVSHIYYVEVRGVVHITSAGASGAVCGLIGAAVLGAKKSGPQEADVARRMRSWALMMVIWGFAVPGINNAAHLGGFVAGAVLARLTPAGITQTVTAQRILSVLTMACFGVVLGCVALMMRNLDGFPRSLEDDGEPRSILGAYYYDGREEKYSSQKRIFDDCLTGFEKEKGSAKTEQRCELNMRVNDHMVDSYLILASVLRERGDPERAEKLESIGARIRESAMKMLGAN